jgi:thiol-disulfide isomerase/thioredoxin
MEPTVIQFYTRDRCHLCDQAKAILHELKNEWDITIEEFDIDESDELTERYGLMIPVVVIDSEEVAYGVVNKIFISKRLQEKTSNL